jgi:hypothetical protein
VAEQTTFVKVDRNILQWRWYQDANTMRVFIHLILMANVKDHDFEKITIHRGELVTSLASLSKQLKMSVRSVRTSLEHLKSTGEVTSRNYPHYQVISIAEYDKYQAVPTRQSTSNRQGIDKASTSNRQQSKNIRMKEGKNEKNIYMPPTVAQVEEFALAEGLTLDAAAFIQYNEARGWQGVKDWRPLVRLRASQMTKDQPQDDDDGLDVFGRPIRKEFK